MKDKLLWEKWRPKSLEDVILLPRISKNFTNGVNRNFIFHGHFGSGKTTLARVLIKNSPHLEINSSLFTSIDVLRTKIDDFCANTPMFEDSYSMKYVFLDEFERVSAQYQDALKAFIEEYKNHVRFILVTNHINKVSDGIISRCTCINFDCQNIEEEKYLKKEIYQRVMNKIVPAEQINITKEQLVQIINSKFPDFRSILVELHHIKETGEVNNSTSNINNKLKLSLYKMISDKSMDYEKVYHFLMTNFGPEKIDELLKLLGRPFIDWCFSDNRESIDKLFEINKVVTEKSALLESKTTDPIVLGMSVIGEIRSIL